ncbi:MAG: DUF11 domain-containing protein [Candidatus Ancillula trichonymphae]|nr:DUF11 domain-containing protein [Candidatus Ancillula trichonymphae]
MGAQLFGVSIWQLEACLNNPNLHVDDPNCSPYLVSKTVKQKEVKLGDEVNYTEVKNTSSVAIPQAGIIDKLPKAVQFVSADIEHGFSFYDKAGHLFVWDIGELAPGETMKATVNGKVVEDLNEGELILNRVRIGTTVPFTGTCTGENCPSPGPDSPDDPYEYESWTESCVYSATNFPESGTKPGVNLCTW